MKVATRSTCLSPRDLCDAANKMQCPCSPSAIESAEPIRMPHFAYVKTLLLLLLSLCMAEEAYEGSMSPTWII